MKLCLPCHSIVVIQVYMPSANHSIQTFKDVIDKLSDTIAIYNEESYIIVMGDFNIQLCSRNVYSVWGIDKTTPRTLQTIMSWQLLLTRKHVTVQPLPSYRTSPTRIDHILTDDYVESLVQQCSVLEDAHWTSHVTFLYTLAYKPTVIYQQDLCRNCYST